MTAGKYAPRAPEVKKSGSFPVDEGPPFPLNVADVEIGRASADDWEALKSVRLAALHEAPYAFGSTYDEERRWSDDSWRDWAQKSDRAQEMVVFLAFDAGRCVGMVGGFKSSDDFAELGAMWVAPEARRRGVGRALVDAVVDWARSIGQRRVLLWVADANVGARDLYAAMAFEPTGETMPLPSNPEVEVARLERIIG
jgi:GNAT superfamily N-acetyltransferase